MKKSAVPSLDEFLNQAYDPAWHGGHRCGTCSHASAEAINGELIVFAEAKKAGNGIPWSRFFRERLRKVYGLKLVPTAIMRHVRECLEID